MSVQIHIEIDEKTLRALVKEHLQKTLGTCLVWDHEIEIQVKSKQNFKSEWEKAAFRAVIDKLITEESPPNYM